MLQLQVLTGKKTGAKFTAQNFPIVIGRNASAHLQLQEDGVWDNHCQIDYVPADGFYLKSTQPAITLLNDKPVQEARLKNGDIITAGSVKIRFWLSEVKQKNFLWRERLTWLAIALLSLSQILLIYYLTRHFE